MRYLDATVKAASDDAPGSFEAIASTTSLDRDREVVAADAFNPLPKMVPVHVDHRMDSEGLVGSGVPYYDRGVLKVQGTFAGTPRAQIIRQLVKEGHLSAMSVGFYDATKKEVRGVQTITKAELLEVSFVTVPSNRDARVLVSRGYGNTRASATDVAVAVSSATATLALAQLALLDADEQERRHTALKSPSQTIADAERLLAQLRGQR